MSGCKTGLQNISSVERDPVFLSQKAKPGGVATLDANGKIPLSQIDLRAVFTEHDPVYNSEKAQPFGCATLDGSALVLKNQLGTGTADATKFLRGDGVWAPASGGSGAAEGWLLTGTDVSLATSTSKVVVGALPTIAKFGVVGDNPADITTIVRAAPAQAATIMEVQNSAGVTLLAIGATVYVEYANGSTAPVSLAGHGRQRYNNTTGNKGFEVSVDAGPWERVIADEREVERIAAMLDL